MVGFWRILNSQTRRAEVFTASSWPAWVFFSFKENALCCCLQIECAFYARKGRNSLLYYTNEIQRISVDNTAKFCLDLLIIFLQILLSFVGQSLLYYSSC